MHFFLSLCVGAKDFPLAHAEFWGNISTRYSWNAEESASVFEETLKMNVSRHLFWYRRTNNNYASCECNAADEIKKLFWTFAIVTLGIRIIIMTTFFCSWPIKLLVVARKHVFKIYIWSVRFYISRKSWKFYWRYIRSGV